jgi:transcriptional regulator with XRE-family HTH domain
MECTNGGKKIKSLRGEGPTPRELATGSGAPDASMRSLEHAIGAQVRDFRRSAGLTIAELAEAAGVSASTVSKIENGLTTASLSILHQLADTLNLPLTMLLATFESRRGCSIVLKGEGVNIRRRGTRVGHQYQQLSQLAGGNIVLETYLITLSAGAEPHTEFQHAGLQFIYMLGGEVSYLHGESSHQLRPGDCLLLQSAEFHGPKALIKLPAVYLSIIVSQR